MRVNVSQSLLLEAIAFNTTALLLGSVHSET